MESAALFPPETLVSRSPNQISGNLDGSVMLMSVENGEYYAINGAGNRIWALLENPISVGEIIARLLEEFAVSPAIAEQEVRAFLLQLQEKGLLQKHLSQF